VEDRPCKRRGGDSDFGRQRKNLLRERRHSKCQLKNLEERAAEEREDTMPIREKKRQVPAQTTCCPRGKIERNRFKARKIAEKGEVVGNEAAKRRKGGEKGRVARMLHPKGADANGFQVEGEKWKGVFSFTKREAPHRGETPSLFEGGADLRWGGKKH